MALAAYEASLEADENGIYKWYLRDGDKVICIDDFGNRVFNISVSGYCGNSRAFYHKFEQGKGTINTQDTREFKGFLSGYPEDRRMYKDLDEYSFWLRIFSNDLYVIIETKEFVAASVQAPPAVLSPTPPTSGADIFVMGSRIKVDLIPSQRDGGSENVKINDSVKCFLRMGKIDSSDDTWEWCVFNGTHLLVLDDQEWVTVPGIAPETFKMEFIHFESPQPKGPKGKLVTRIPKPVITATKNITEGQWVEWFGKETIYIYLGTETASDFDGEI